jgi:hypothetical protein
MSRWLASVVLLVVTKSLHTKRFGVHYSGMESSVVISGSVETESIGTAAYGSCRNGHERRENELFRVGDPSKPIMAAAGTPTACLPVVGVGALVGVAGCHGGSIVFCAAVLW